MAILKSTTYTCSDGSVFDSYTVAIAHECEVERSAANKAEKWIRTSYGASKLLKTHTLDDVGVWRICGEDPNCDLGGHHYQPDLGTVQGKLRDVVEYAVKLDDFYTWGSGGDIIAVDIKKV